MFKHVMSSRHRRFAVNNDNFLQLDEILSRVQRRPLEDVYLEEQKRIECCRLKCSGVVR